MDTAAYDAIVVGARCAGSPTAMLLARKGYRVLRHQSDPTIHGGRHAHHRFYAAIE
jgi:flavin-dependent dehydrogenase